MMIDSLILFGLVKELKQQLTGSQIRQIHQADPRMMDMELFHPSSGAGHLILSARTPPSVYLDRTENGKRSYMLPQTFCMTLRKHLESSRLSEIEQIHMDRILAFRFDRIETEGRILTKTLYAELIPSAPNLVLTENGVIIDACIKSRKMQRLLSPQSPYELPDGNRRLDFFQFTAEELKDLLQSPAGPGMTVEQRLFSVFNGFSKILSGEVCFRAGISPDLPIESLSGEEAEKLASSIKRAAGEAENSGPVRFYLSSADHAVPSLIPLQHLKESSLPPISVNQYIRQGALASGGLLEDRLADIRKKLSSLIKKEERKIKKMEEELQETDDMALCKKRGDLLAIHSGEKGTGRSGLTVDDLFEDPPRPVTIPLRPEYSVSDNSQLYYKRYNKLKKRLVIGREKIDETRPRLEYLKNLFYFLTEVRDGTALQELEDELSEAGIPVSSKSKKTKSGKKDPASEPLCFRIGGYAVSVGRNSRQNEMLTFHTAKPGDLWMHARQIPGSHVIISSEGTDVPEEVIESAARLAAWYSRGRQSGKVDIDFTEARHVRKIRGGPPGLVYYTHQKTVTAVPQKQPGGDSPVR